MKCYERENGLHEAHKNKNRLLQCPRSAYKEETRRFSISATSAQRLALNVWLGSLMASYVQTFNIRVLWFLSLNMKRLS